MSFLPVYIKSVSINSKFCQKCHTWLCANQLKNLNYTKHFKNTQTSVIYTNLITTFIIIITHFSWKFSKLIITGMSSSSCSTYFCVLVVQHKIYNIIDNLQIKGRYKLSKISGLTPYLYPCRNEDWRTVVFSVLYTVLFKRRFKKFTKFNTYKFLWGQNSIFVTGSAISRVLNSFTK